VRRTQQSQAALEEKLDLLLAKFNLAGAAEQGEGEPLTGETAEKSSIETRLLEMDAKLDLVLEAIAGLQPASKKKTTKTDPPPDETDTGTDGGK